MKVLQQQSEMPVIPVTPVTLLTENLLYVMSERGYKVHWVQNILHNQKIKFSINNIISEGNARIIGKDNAPELASEVQKLMMTKYGWNKGLIIELTISS